MGRTVHVTTTITFSYEVPIEHYPGMTDDEICEFEMTLPLSNQVMIMEDNENIDHSCKVEIRSGTTE